MKDNHNLCLGCMNPIPEGQTVCPICQFQLSDYRANPRCLPLGMILHGRYKIGKVLGEGGFGITYIAWDQETESPVAIKEYFPSSIANRDCSKGNATIYFFDKDGNTPSNHGFEKYAHEAEMLQGFSELDGIVSIRDFFYENNTAYIVMEYIDGITLKEYLTTNGTLTPAETFELMTPILLALEKIHDRGIIHRDISPDNIMIRVDGAFKLIDFGAARFNNEDDGKSLTIILKRGFAPEEQYRSKGTQGPWTDIYALCATMYKMMTNQIPPEAMERLVSDDLIPLTEYGLDITLEQCEAIEKGLAVRAENRYQRIKDLRLALTNATPKEKNLHMIAIIQNALGKIIGYRLYDMDVNRIIDMEPDKLFEQMQDDILHVNNLMIYKDYLQPIGGSLKRYPVLDTSDHLVQRDNYYFVQHSLAKGYQCLNYKGMRCYFNEVDMKNLIKNNKVSNMDKVQLFTAIREKKAMEYVPAHHPGSVTTTIPKPISPSEEIREKEEHKQEPGHIKLSLKTDSSNTSLHSSDQGISRNVGAQLRLQMANKTHLSDIADKHKKKKKFF